MTNTGEYYDMFIYENVVIIMRKNIKHVVLSAVKFNRIT